MSSIPKLYATERRTAQSIEKVIAMKAHTQSSSTAGQAGAAIGRAWRRWLRQEHRLIDGLVSKGLPATIAKALLWIVKLLVLGIVVYASFRLVLLLVFALAAAWVA